MEIGTIGTNGRMMLSDVGTGLINIYGGEHPDQVTYNIKQESNLRILAHAGGME